MQENRREFSILKARILQYLDFKGVSRYECYKKTGMSRSVLSQPNGLTEDNMLRFLDYYQDISIVWLLTGKGKMLLSEQQETVFSDGEYKEKYIDVLEENRRLHNEIEELKKRNIADSA